MSSPYTGRPRVHFPSSSTFKVAPSYCLQRSAVQSASSDCQTNLTDIPVPQIPKDSSGLFADDWRFVYLHGLRCGRCGHCRLSNPNCEEWEFHKFRRTYITAICPRVDLRTAQEYAGHARITSAERYLKTASAAAGQKRISAIDFTKPFYS